MTKDHIRPLAKFLAEADTHRLYEAGQKAIREIEEEIKDHQDQRDLIRRLIGRYADSKKVVSTEALQKLSAEPMLPPLDRSTVIRHMALRLVSEGKTVLSAPDIVQALQADGIELGVKQPGSVVGTVLKGMKEFVREELNRFRYVGSNTNGVEAGNAMG